MGPQCHVFFPPVFPHSRETTRGTGRTVISSCGAPLHRHNEPNYRIYKENEKEKKKEKDNPLPEYMLCVVHLAFVFPFSFFLFPFSFSRFPFSVFRFPVFYFFFSRSPSPFPGISADRISDPLPLCCHRPPSPTPSWHTTTQSSHSPPPQPPPTITTSTGAAALSRVRGKGGPGERMGQGGGRWWGVMGWDGMIGWKDRVQPSWAHAVASRSSAQAEWMCHQRTKNQPTN